MADPTDPRDFIKMAEEALADAKRLRANAGTERNVLGLVDKAVEMALKGGLASFGIRAKDFRHKIGKMAETLAQKWPDFTNELCQSLCDHATVPRIGETSCETHVEAGYAMNLDWEQISLDDRLKLAERTLVYIKARCIPAQV